jgi:hypothetical protein
MNVRFFVILAVGAACLARCSGGNGENDIVVVTPPRTEEQIARSKAYSDRLLRASAGLSYLDIEDALASKSFFTLGNGVERCDHIAVVSVAEAQSQTLSEKIHACMIRFNVVSNLLGVLQQPETIIVPWASDRSPPLEGERLLVFLAEKNLSRSEEFILWDYMRKGKQEKHSDRFFVFGDSYNVISLEDKQQKDAFLTSVSGYVKNLRRGSLDEEEYYLFLIKHMDSPCVRIKEDAISDMVKFLNSVSLSFDLNRIPADANIDEGIKNYVRLFLIPEREQKTP